jgi:HSP20 family protein
MFWWTDPLEEFLEELERMRRRFRRLLRRIEIPEMYESFPVDVFEENDEIVIRADLPGFKKNEIQVRVLENAIDIKAEKKEEVEEKAEGFYKAERKYGKLRRIIPLPLPVDSESAKAKLENGVLEIRVKKKIKERKGKEVKIE